MVNFKIFFFRDSTNADEQEIFMYDIPTQTVNKLNGELSTAFVNVAEENATAQDEESIATTNPEEDSTESIDTFQGQPSNIVETYVKFEGKKDQEVEPKIQINSGYSVIKNE